MGKNEKTPITVNDKEYFVDDFTEQEQIFWNHVQDLDRKLANAQFNVDQLNLGRMKAVELLAASLESEDAQEVDG
jgi:hypothetical protein